MTTIREYINHKPKPRRIATVNKDREFHFRRAGKGFYFSNRPAANGEHIVIEQRGQFWILRFEESGEISRHGSAKACKFALATLIAGDDSLVC